MSNDKDYIKFLEESVAVQKYKAPCDKIVNWKGEGKLNSSLDGDIDYLVKKITKGDKPEDKAIQSESKTGSDSPLSILEKELDEADEELDAKDIEKDMEADKDIAEEGCKGIDETIDLSNVESDILSRLISEMDAMDSFEDEDMIDTGMGDDYVDDELDTEALPAEDDYLGI